MSIYDKANELAEELKNSKEVVDLREANKNIEGNELNKKVLDDFRNIQMNAYSEQMKAGKVSDETMKEFNDIGARISNNESVSQYIQLEQKFTVMWQEILKY